MGWITSLVSVCLLEVLIDGCGGQIPLPGHLSQAGMLPSSLFQHNAFLNQGLPYPWHSGQIRQPQGYQRQVRQNSALTPYRGLYRGNGRQTREARPIHSEKSKLSSLNNEIKHRHKRIRRQTKRNGSNTWKSFPFRRERKMRNLPPTDTAHTDPSLSVPAVHYKAILDQSKVPHYPTDLPIQTLGQDMSSKAGKAPGIRPQAKAIHSKTATDHFKILDLQAQHQHVRSPHSNKDHKPTPATLSSNTKPRQAFTQTKRIAIEPTPVQHFDPAQTFQSGSNQNRPTADVIYQQNQQSMVAPSDSPHHETFPMWDQSFQHSSRNSEAHPPSTQHQQWQPNQPNIKQSQRFSEQPIRPPPPGKHQPLPLSQTIPPPQSHFNTNEQPGTDAFPHELKHNAHHANENHNANVPINHNDTPRASMNRQSFLSQNHQPIEQVTRDPNVHKQTRNYFTTSKANGPSQPPTDRWIPRDQEHSNSFSQHLNNIQHTQDVTQRPIGRSGSQSSNVAFSQTQRPLETRKWQTNNFINHRSESNLPLDQKSNSNVSPQHEGFHQMNTVSAQHQVSKSNPPYSQNLHPSVERPTSNEQVSQNTHREVPKRNFQKSSQQHSSHGVVGDHNQQLNMKSLHQQKTQRHQQGHMTKEQQPTSGQRPHLPARQPPFKDNRQNPKRKDQKHLGRPQSKKQKNENRKHQKQSKVLDNIYSLTLNLANAVDAQNSSQTRSDIPLQRKHPADNTPTPTPHLKSELASMFKKLQTVMEKLKIIPSGTIDRKAVSGPIPTTITPRHNEQNQRKRPPNAAKSLSPLEKTKQEALSKVQSSLRALGIPIMIDPHYKFGSEANTTTLRPQRVGQDQFNPKQVGIPVSRQATSSPLKPQKRPMSQFQGAHEQSVNFQHSIPRHVQDAKGTALDPLNVWHPPPNAKSGTPVKRGNQRNRNSQVSNKKPSGEVIHNVLDTRNGRRQHSMGSGRRFGGRRIVKTTLMNSSLKANGSQPVIIQSVDTHSPQVFDPSTYPPTPVTAPTTMATINSIPKRQEWVSGTGSRNSKIRNSKSGKSQQQTPFPPRSHLEHKANLPIEWTPGTGSGNSNWNNNSKIRNLKTSGKSHQQTTLSPRSHVDRKPNLPIKTSLNVEQKRLDVTNNSTSIEQKKNRTINITKTVRKIEKPAGTQQANKTSQPLVNNQSPPVDLFPGSRNPTFDYQTGMLPADVWSSAETPLVPPSSSLNTSQAAEMLKLLEALQTLKNALGHSPGAVNHGSHYDHHHPPTVKIVLQVPDFENRYKVKCKCFPKSDGCPADLVEEPLLDMCDVTSSTPCCEDG